MATAAKSDEDADLVISHLRQLVESYEGLVEEMSITLVKNQEAFDQFSKNTMESECLDTDSDLKESRTCPRCTESRRVIDNLLSQLSSLTKAKNLTTALWHASAEQIEQLEQRLKVKTPIPVSTEAKPSWENQQKLYQTYISRLETRMEQCGNEKNFYRAKLVEAKIENEEKLKDLQLQKHKEAELIKKTYIKEIQVVKEQLEKERLSWRNNFEKKLAEERQRWIADENERRDHMKKTWRTQLDHLLAEQESLVARETQLCEKLHETQMELLHAQQILWCTPQALSSTAVNPQVQPGAATHFCQKQDAKTSEMTKNHESVRNETKLQTMKQCGHDECVTYSQHEKVIRANEKLGDEIYRLEKAKRLLQFDHTQNVRRMEQRIRDLERLNADLQSRLLQVIAQKMSSSGLPVDAATGPCSKISTDDKSTNNSNCRIMQTDSGKSMENAVSKSIFKCGSSRENTTDIDDDLLKCSLPPRPSLPPVLGVDRHDYNSSFGHADTQKDQEWILREQSLLSKIQQRVEKDREFLISPTIASQDSI